MMHCFPSDPTNSSMDFVFVENNPNTCNLIAQSVIRNKKICSIFDFFLHRLKPSPNN